MSKPIERLFEHQQKWSAETFGDHMDCTGVLDHIKKELDEISNDPNDPEEWGDLFILAMDGLWRDGQEFNRSDYHVLLRQTNPSKHWVSMDDLLGMCEYARKAKMFTFLMAVASRMIFDCREVPEQVVHAKQQKNVARKWPEKSEMDTSKAIEHVKL